MVKLPVTTDFIPSKTDFSQLSHLKIHLKHGKFKEYLQATYAASIKAILSEHVSRCLASSSGA
jgi:hypothetical protein